MTNTAIDKKNHQQNHLSSNKFSNDNNSPNMSSLSGSEGQKRLKISVNLLGDGRRANNIDDNQSSEAFSTSSPRVDKENARFASLQKEGADDKSSGIHVNVDNHKKPLIKGKITIEKFKENEKRDKPSEKSHQNEGRVEERGIANFRDQKSPKDDDENRFKSNNSVFYASLVTKDVEVPDKNGRIHHVPKNYMKVKVPKSPKNQNNFENNYTSRGAEINPDDINNTPTSNRRRVKKKVPKNSGSEYRHEKPQLSISQGKYSRTPQTIDEQPERKRSKHRKDNNKYIPTDYNQQQFPATPNYYYPYNFNNGGPYIELEIVPEEDQNAEKRYPESQKKRPRKPQSTRRPRSRSKRHYQSSRGSRGNYYYSDDYEDNYYDSYDDSYNDQYSRGDRRPSKKRPASANSSTQNIESASTQTDKASEHAYERAATPKFEQPPTPTQNVGTETKLNRNSSSTQTSFLHNSRATKSVETSSLGQNRNDAFDDYAEEEDINEVNTNENVFNSPKNSDIRERSKAYQNSPGSSSPKTFNVPRSPHSPRSPIPTYKSDVEGLTNSARKLNGQSPIMTRGSNLNINNDNSNEVSVNHVPNSSDDEDGNVENDLSISSLEKKIKQIKPRSPKDRNAEFEEEQQKAASSTKYLSESNSPSQHDDSNLFGKKESSKNSRISNKDESYEECVLNPSRGSSILSQQKQSTKSHHSLNQLSESQEESNEQPYLEEEVKESSHMSAKSNHSRPVSRNITAENSLNKGKSSHNSASFNLNVPSQNQGNSITTESTKQPSLINEPSSSKKNGQSSKVSFNSHMSHSSNKLSNASKSTINIESEVQDFITPDKKSTSSKKPSSKQNSLISEKSNHNNSNIGSSINSLHNSNLGSSIHSPRNSKIGSSLHSIHNSNGSNSIVSENSTHQNPSLISNNSASTFIGDKAQNQFSEAFDNLSEITTSDVSDRFIKKRGFDIDSVIDSSITNNSAISIGSNATDKDGSVLIEEIEEEEVEEEIEDSQATRGGESSFSNLFEGSTKQSNELSSDFNLFSSEASTIKSRRVNKRLVDPSELYMKLGLQVLETKTRDPRVTEAENENPALSNSIHDVQIEPAVPTEPKSLFVQIGFKDQDTILSTPTRKCQKLEEPENLDEAFSTTWESNYLVTGFENSAILFTLCRTEFSGFKKLASVNIPLFSFKDLSDGWFDLIPENDDDEARNSGFLSAPNSPKSPSKSGVYGKIHIVTNVESAISLPPFDIDKQVEIIASRDQINLSNRNQEEIERIKAISFDLSSNSNSSSIHDSDDFEAQKKKLAKKFNNFKGQFSSVSDVSAAYMNSENADSEGYRIKQRKIGSNLQTDDNKFNSSSSHSRRRKKESNNSNNNSVKSEKEESLNDADSLNFNSASSSKRRRIKVPKNSNNNSNNQQKTDSGLDNLNFSAHSSSSHGGSRHNKKLSSASEGQGFQFEMVSSSSTSKKKQNQDQNQNQNQSEINKQNQSKVSNINSTELSNYLKDVSSTMPETITFDNSSTAVGASNLTMSAFQSPQKNAAAAPVATTSYKNSIDDDDDDDEIDAGIAKLTISTESGNSDAPNDYAEVKKEKTLSRDPPKRTYVNNSNKKESDASIDDMMMDFDDSC